LSKLQLINNSECDWSNHEFWYDNSGNPHKQHLHYGHDYELEGGTLLDDVDALQNGYIFDQEYDNE